MYSLKLTVHLLHPTSVQTYFRLTCCQFLWQEKHVFTWQKGMRVFFMRFGSTYQATVLNLLSWLFFSWIFELKIETIHNLILATFFSINIFSTVTILVDTNCIIQIYFKNWNFVSFYQTAFITCTVFITLHVLNTASKNVVFTKNTFSFIRNKSWNNNIAFLYHHKIATTSLFILHNFLESLRYRETIHYLFYTIFFNPLVTGRQFTHVSIASGLFFHLSHYVNSNCNI